MITLLLTIAIVGFLVYCLVTYVPMPEIFKKAIIVITVILMILYLVRIFNLDIPISR